MDPFVQIVVIPFVIISVSVGIAYLVKNVWVAPLLALVLKLLANYLIFEMTHDEGTISRKELFSFTVVTALVALIFGLYLFLSLAFLEKRKQKLPKSNGK